MHRPAAELRELRYAANLTQEKLAELANTSRITIQNRESGRFRPCEGQRQPYADALGISLDQLNQVINGKLSAEDCLSHPSHAGPPNTNLICTSGERHHNPCEPKPNAENDTNRRQFMAMVLTGGPGAMAAALEAVRSGLLLSFSEHHLARLHADDWDEVTQEYGRSYLTTPAEALISR